MSRIEDGLRLRLRLLDVRLVEGVDAEDRAGDRGRKLEAKELGPEVARIGEVDVDALPVHPVRGLARRRHEPLALLAGRLGDELLEPEPEAAGIAEDDLVASLLPGRAEREPELEPRIPVGDAACVVHLLGARQQPSDVDAGQCRRHEPEDGKRRVAPADRGLPGDRRHATLARERLQRRAGIGDHEERLGPLSASLPEVVELTACLHGRPRLRRDDEERAVDLQPAKRGRMRGIEHLQRRSRQPPDHERGEARSSHSTDDDSLPAVRLDKAIELLPALTHPQRLVEPPQPLRLVVPRPDCRVTLPDPFEQLAGIELRQ